MADEEINTASHKAFNFLVKWHLPLFFVIVLSIGYFVPIPGTKAKEVNLVGFCIAGNDDYCVYDSISHFCIGIIFFCSGIKLKTSEVLAAVTGSKSLLTIAFAVLSILLISPCITFYTITWDFIEEEFAIGLSIFFAQATTLSSGPIIAAQANGNVALALLLTVVTNILAVVTMPAFISYTLSEFGDVEVTVDPVPIIIKLCFLLIAPLAVGKFLRNFRFVRETALRYKITLKLFASALLSLIIWMNISDSKESLETVEGKSIGILFGAGLGIHILLLCFNYAVTTFVLRCDEREKRSVIIVTSQKTLPVSITVIEILGNLVVRDTGLATIPVIIAHFVQIVFDAFLAGYWAEISIEKDLISIPDDDTEEESQVLVEKDETDNKTALVIS